MNIKTLSVKCPTCKKEVLMNETSSHRPFCSDRCKTVDFGDWANENNCVIGESIIDEEDVWSDDLT